MKLIDADEAVKIAERSFAMWNMAMATADTQKEINLIFRKQELCKAVKLVVEHCPTVAPVKHGRWINGDCSECGFPIPTDDRIDYIAEADVHYCYHCGAKMDVK